MFDFVTLRLFDRLWGSFLLPWQVESTSSNIGSFIDPEGRQATAERTAEPSGSPLEFGSFIDPEG